ncbi:MAG: 30S ribosomal protein S1 [Clostridium sp.]|uniref:30S ribosomal protein S1 n=1 Tax=Clostridium TaxID=1485 RepID=UPI00189BC62D|nr:MULTISPECIES: 30S ribosomal protein S1 [Clostridium]MDU5210332.1 30S ribosomal protein S1 [Clostridium sp.]MDU6762906.1 30S ribosomal protein S1 [Clostridium sp.]MDY4720325.1 30S ribosomal protein S1 [Clostridium paraputrificum]
MTNETNMNSMSEFLNDYDVKRIREGEILDGKVIEVNDKEVIVNINYAFDGVISKEELTYEGKSPEEVVKKGDEFKVYVLSPNDGEGYVLLSRVKALAVTEREELKKAFKSGELISVNVKEAVKGGVVAYYGGVRIFIPGSQLGRGRVESSDVVGKTLEVKLIELDLRNRKVVASRRVIEEEQYQIEKKRMWASVNEGEKRTGVVTKIAKFGAFVDIGGVQGLVHINDLAWGRVKRVEEVVKVGDQVEVFVGEVDREKERLALVLKDVNSEPWKVHGDSIKDGAVMEGKVVRLTNFGAFVEVLPGVEGLVHITEITDENIAKASDVLTVGQNVKVKVLSVNKEDKKLSLSIKEAVERNKEYMKYNDSDEGLSLGDLFKDLKF